jgi:hypothetical protein
MDVQLEPLMGEDLRQDAKREKWSCGSSVPSKRKRSPTARNRFFSLALNDEVQGQDGSHGLREGLG